MFHSNTTSPDSGASLSPGVESVEFGRHYQHSNSHPHSNVHHPHSSSHSSHHGPVPRTTRIQYGNEAEAGHKWTDKANPSNSAYSSRGGQGHHPSSSRHLLKPHPSAPLMLHPPPASHSSRHPPPSHPSAFSPTRPNFVKSWSLSVNNLSQQDTKQEHWHKTDTRDQWRQHPSATPLTASSNAAFTLPESYREGFPHGGHAYQQSQQYRHKVEAQQRSMTLPIGHAHPVARPIPRSQYTSLSQDDLLDGPVRSSAFHAPSQPQYPSFLKHYPDNLEISTQQPGNRPAGPGHTHNSYSGDDSHPSTPGGPLTNHPAPERQQNLEEVEEESEEVYVCDNLSSVDMLDLLLNISSPHCQIRKLE